MKMNKIALCLILVFALAFSTYAAVDVSFSPQPVSPGESLNITVTNGSYYKYADIYDSGNNLKTTISLCNHPNNCNGTNSVIYNVPSNFRAGVARLRVYDNSLRAYIYGSFSVIGGNCHSNSLWHYSYCNSGCLCDIGEGDCDNDNECKDGLNCVNNLGSNYGQASWIDVCEVAPPTGSIRVNSNTRYANIYLDGIYKGSTGYWKSRTISQVEAGYHSLNVTKSGYSAYTTPVNVVAGQTAYVNANLQADCSTRIPWSSNYCTSDCPCSNGNGDCDNSNECQTGVNCVNNVGSNYGQTWWFDVCEGQIQTGSIYVTSTPSGANLYLDGDYLGTTPKTINEASVGNHALNLTKSGYHPYTTSVNVVAGQTTNVNATLTLIPTPTPSTGSIYVTSTPSGANLYLDGDYLGTTPKTIDNTSVGNHTLNVIKSGYPPYTALVNVVAGQTTNVNATLTIIDATSPSLTAFFTATTNNSATLIVNATDSDSYVDNIGLWYKSPAHSYWYKWGNMYYDCNQQQLCYQEHNITSIDGAGNYTFWVGAYNRDRYSSLKYPSIYFTS